ncbi:MAG: U32 family peptidase [Desulfobacterales bacterium]|nr:U32 family peptidase [Desulfobacterales bacterium]
MIDTAPVMNVSEQNKVELLAPAGNYEKLEIAIHYGADAVYLAGKDFSLRNFSGNFSDEELAQAIRLAHKHSVKVYLACNIYPRNHEADAISEYLEKIGQIGPDAIIMADPGIISTAQKIIPDIPIHLSTQANTTSYLAAQFWERLGIKRVNTARELSLLEIKQITEKTNLEVEAFAHGAMCISYSGRCLLSNFMTQRDSNRGMCAQSCRWKYSVVEEKRPGLYMPFAEDNRGAYIFNSNDLCMVEHIPEMIDAGIISLKIEGRMKSINYLASTVRIYRQAIDLFYENPEKFHMKPEWISELGSIANRAYCTGFYFNDPEQTIPGYEVTHTSPVNIFVAKVSGNTDDHHAEIGVRNKIFTGDEIEIIQPRGPIKKDRIEAIIDSDGNQVPFAQPNSTVTVKLGSRCEKFDLLRRLDTIISKTEQVINP